MARSTSSTTSRPTALQLRRRGPQGQAHPRRPRISGSLVAEYVDASFRDAILADTSMTIVKTFTSAPMSCSDRHPGRRFDGDIVKASTDLAMQEIKWVGLDGLSAA